MCERLQVSNVAKQFYAWLTLRARPRTVDFYRMFLERFARHCEGIPLPDVKRIHVETFSAKHHALTAVCRFLRWAHEVAELIERNPSAAVKVPKNGQRTRTLTRAERVAIRRRSLRALRASIVALEETGCRPQELRVLEWESIYPKTSAAGVAVQMGDGRHWFRLEKYKSKERRADQSKPRIIVITPRLGRLLERMRRASPAAAGLIFKGPAGRAWTPNMFRCAFRRLRAKLDAAQAVNVAGLVPYVYRHTRATALALDGVNAHLMKEWLGHAKVETAARYCHLTEGDLTAIGRRRWK